MNKELLVYGSLLNQYLIRLEINQYRVECRSRRHHAHKQCSGNLSESQQEHVPPYKPVALINRSPQGSHHPGAHLILLVQ